MPCKSLADVHLSPFKRLELIGLNILLLFVPAPGSFVPFVRSSLGNSVCKSIIRFYRHLAQGDTDLPCEPLQAGFSWDVCRQSLSDPQWGGKHEVAFLKVWRRGKTGIHLILSHLWSQRHPPLICLVIGDKHYERIPIPSGFCWGIFF